MRNQTYILPEQESFGMNNSLKLLKHYNLKKNQTNFLQTDWIYIVVVNSKLHVFINGKITKQFIDRNEAVNIDF